MKNIKPGDPQPYDCPECQEKMGYSVFIPISTGYNTFYTPEGIHNGGVYFCTQSVIDEPVTATCSNCNVQLPFKIDRS